MTTGISGRYVLASAFAILTATTMRIFAASDSVAVRQPDTSALHPEKPSSNLLLSKETSEDYISEDGESWKGGKCHGKVGKWEFDSHGSLGETQHMTVEINADNLTGPLHIVGSGHFL